MKGLDEKMKGFDVMKDQMKGLDEKIDQIK